MRIIENPTCAIPDPIPAQPVNVAVTSAIKTAVLNLREASPKANTSQEEKKEAESPGKIDQMFDEPPIGDIPDEF